MTKENLYTPDCIRTFTGKYVNVFSPTPEMIDIVDIAHSLSRQCRFAGHLPKFYSVAEHSVVCSALATTKKNAIEALLHDASEAYLMDIAKPIKLRMPEYNRIEENMMEVISKKYGFKWPKSEEIKNIDKQILELEWNIIFLQNKQSDFEFKCWQPDEAKKMFLGMFDNLTRN